MSLHIVSGDLFEQDVDALVNPWNINVFPRWWPSSGISGQLKRRTGPEPWVELRRRGRMRTGSAQVTGAGQMPGIRAIIHVAGLHPWWRASEASVRASARAMAAAADREGLARVATPLVGAGAGGVPADRALAWISAELGARAEDGVRWLVVTPRR